MKIKHHEVINSSVGSGYYNKPEFEEIEDEYYPRGREAFSMAEQIVQAIVTMVYRYYNDGDVPSLDSSVNNAAVSPANWLYGYVPATRHILDRVLSMRIFNRSDYQDLLRELADMLLDEEFLGEYQAKRPVGNVFRCDDDGPFLYECEDEDWDEDWDD